MKDTNVTEIQTNLKRCPRCNLLPEVSVSKNHVVTLSCPRHGHMAQGDTLATATLHWNRYLEFIAEVA